MKIEGRLARWLIALAFPLLKLWVATLRFKFEDPGNLRAMPNDKRLIGALWHNRLLLIAHVVRKFFPGRHGAALISASRDGGIIADVVERYGFQPVRGSSSRKGSIALLQLAELISKGDDAIITPDGPRGPVYELEGGIIFLAQKTAAVIIPLNFEYSSCWRVKSWDRFILPKPFSKVRVMIGLPHHVKPTPTDADFEAERQRLQDVMMSLVEMR